MSDTKRTMVIRLAGENATGPAWEELIAQAKEAGGKISQQMGRGMGSKPEWMENLKEQFGRESAFGGLGEIFKGGGALIGITAFAEVAKDIADGFGKMEDDARDINKNWADIAEDGLKSIPVVGTLAEAGEAISEDFTGTLAAIKEMNSDIELGNKLMDQRRKLAGEIHEAQFAAAEREMKNQASITELGLVGTARQQQALKDRQDAEDRAREKDVDKQRDHLRDLGDQLAPLKEQIGQKAKDAGALAGLSPGMVGQLQHIYESGQLPNAEQDAAINQLRQPGDDRQWYNVLGSFSKSQFQAAGDLEGLQKKAGGITSEQNKLGDLISPQAIAERNKEDAQRHAAEQSELDRQINEHRIEQAKQSEMRISDERSRAMEEGMRMQGNVLGAGLESIKQKYDDAEANIKESARKAFVADPLNAIKIFSDETGELIANQKNRTADNASLNEQAQHEAEDREFAHQTHLRDIQVSAFETALNAQGRNIEARNLQINAAYIKEVADAKQHALELIRTHKDQADQINKQRDEDIQAAGQQRDIDLQAAKIDALNAIGPVSMHAGGESITGTSSSALSAIAMSGYQKEVASANYGKEVKALQDQLGPIAGGGSKANGNAVLEGHAGKTAGLMQDLVNLLRQGVRMQIQ
jgi:hypothetical protein